MASAVSSPPASSADAGARAVVLGAAQKYGINPATLWGVYGAETGYGSDVKTSSAGAVGPFQFEPSTAKSLGVNPLDFKSAAYGAADYLSQYKGRGTLGMLSAYNAGPAGALQPEYAATVAKDAQTFGPNAAAQVTDKAPNVSSVPANPTLAGTTPASSAPSPRSAIVSALLRSGGSGLSAAGLLKAVESVPATPPQNPLSPAASGTAALPAAPAQPVGDQVAGSTPTPPSEFQRMVQEANKIAGAHSNYEWGGGHNPTFAPTTGSGHGSGPGIGYDCSGAISAILHAAGKLAQPMVAQQFMSYGQAGPGGKDDLTIYASPSHVFAEINGRFFGTSMANAGGGAGWFQQAETAGYVVRHVSLAGAPNLHLNAQNGNIIPYHRPGG